MADRIIYPNDTGGVCVVIPTGEVSLDVVARKDVPAGKPYKLVDSADIPSDRTFRNAWEADFSSPDGVGEGV